MRFIDLDDLEDDRNFWYASTGFMYLAALGQFALKEFLLAIATLGMAITFSAIGYQKINEE